MIINIKDSFQSAHYFLNHRCFVISECSSDNKHLAVNMTSIRDRSIYDKSCILQVQDLPNYIRHSSFIYYEKAEVLDHELVLNSPIIQIPETLLKKIQLGARKSPHFPRKYKKYFDLF